MSIARPLARAVPSALAMPITGSGGSLETDFVMTVEMAADGDAFDLKAAATASYDCVVDWGDGSTSTVVSTAADSDPALIHTYATAGTYTIRVSGTFPRIQMKLSTTPSALRTVQNLGFVGWASNGLNEAFQSCDGMTSFAAGNTDTSSVTTLRRMLRECSSLVSADLSGMDTSSATSVEQTFNNCPALTTVDLTGINTSSVTNMRQMFANNNSLTSLDVSGFDTSSVVNMDSVFNACSQLTSLDVSGWDTSSVDSMTSAFSSCSQLTSLDVSGFDTSSVTSMQNMFRFCTSLTDVRCDLFNISAVTNLDSFYQGGTLPTARYDATLISWAGQTVNSGLTVSFGSSQYTSAGTAEAARTSLINDDGWTLSDGGAA